MANVEGTVPPVPERAIAVRSRTSARCSSGSSLRAALTAGPGDVGVDVDPARHHDHPPRVDPASVPRHVGDDLAVLDADVAHLAGDAVGGVVHAAAGDPQHQRRSPIAASTVLDARAAPPPAARAAGPARRPSGARCPAPRCRRPPVANATRAVATAPRRRSHDRAAALGGARRGARADRPPRRARRRPRRARAARRRPARLVAGSRGRSSPARESRSATRARPRRRAALPSPRSAQRDRVAVAAEVAHERGQRQRGELVERAVEERDVAHVAQAPRRGRRATTRRNPCARSSHSASKSIVELDERVRPARRSPSASRRRRRATRSRAGAPAAAGGSPPGRPATPRRARRGRGSRRTSPCSRRSPGSAKRRQPPGIDHGRRAPRRAPPPGAAPRCSSGRARRRAARAPPRRIAAAASTASSTPAASAVDAGDAAAARRAPNHASPSGQVRPSSHTQPQPAHVDLSHRPAPPPATRRAVARPAPRAPPAGSWRRRHDRADRVGPRRSRSPGCGTSRMPRSSQRSLSPIVTSSVANSTALPAAPRARGFDARQLTGAGAQVRVERRRCRTRPRSPRATRSGAG